MDNDNDRKMRRIVNFILVSIVALVVLWLNYDYLDQHLSSNNRVISSYSLEDEKMPKYKAPAVAGVFYAANPEQLQQEIGHYLDVGYDLGEKRPKILIVPHAGYQYSAKVAAKAYVELGNKSAKKIKRVVVVGPSHYVALQGAALPSHDFFLTPLGRIPVDQVAVNDLKKNPLFKVNDKAFVKEHSVEVQLPFLQKVLDDFTIVPIVYGNAEAKELANALEPYARDPETAIVFSADLSHYYDAADAEEIDRGTAKLIENNHPQVNNEMSCGATGINAALILAQKMQMNSQLLDMTHSGNVNGDMSKVVGYGAWMFGEEKKQAKPLSQLEQEVENLKVFAGAYGNDLFMIAKQSLEDAVKGKTYKPSRKDFADQIFDKGASFVTLYKNDELRGCIGSLIPKQAVALDVAQNARKAALEDNRFEPVKPEELKDLSLSIAFLTDYERIRFNSEDDFLEQIVQGTDGVVLRDGDRQGVFLPSVWSQVADKKEFLRELKLKAGMSPSYWSDKIKAYRFRTVEIKKNEN